MSQWVQHISGQGEKWEVEIDRFPDCWGHHSKTMRTTFHLPKSEYILCDPPEQWVDVTHEMTEDEVRCEIERWPHSYRLRKVQVFTGDGATRSMWAFIVEKRV